MLVQMPENNKKVTEKLQLDMPTDVFLDKVIEQQSDNAIDEKEPRSKTDQATLSEQSRIHAMPHDRMGEVLKNWTLEAMLRIWEDILNFQVSGSGSIGLDISRLSSLYQSLLEAILSNTTGQVQVIELKRLDEALAVALNRILNHSMGNLYSILERYDNKDTDVLRASIYKYVTGHSLPVGEKKQLGTERHSPVLPQRVDSLAASKQVKYPTESGVIYQENRKGTISANQQFHQDVQEHQVKLERQQSPFIQSESATLKKSYVSTWNQNLYTVKDMALSERFMQHLTSGGNLFTSGEMNGKSEEFLGVIASVMSMKSQIFASSSGVSKPMSITVLSVVDRLIYHYLSQAELKTEQMMKTTEGKGIRHEVLNQKAIFKVYHHILGQYGASHKPNQAVSEGLNYAYQIFKGKKEDVNYETMSRYKGDAGFFQEQAGRQGVYDGRRELLELERGTRYLERDWKNFLSSFDKQQEKQLLLRPTQESLWGAMVEPKEKVSMKPNKAFMIVVGGVLGLVSLVLLYLLL